MQSIRCDSLRLLFSVLVRAHSRSFARFVRRVCFRFLFVVAIFLASIAFVHSWISFSFRDIFKFKVGPFFTCVIVLVVVGCRCVSVWNSMRRHICGSSYELISFSSLSVFVRLVLFLFSSFTLFISTHFMHILLRLSQAKNRYLSFNSCLSSFLVLLWWIRWIFFNFFLEIFHLQHPLEREFQRSDHREMVAEVLKFCWITNSPISVFLIAFFFVALSSC